MPILVYSIVEDLTALLASKMKIKLQNQNLFIREIHKGLLIQLRYIYENILENRMSDKRWIGK